MSRVSAELEERVARAEVDPARLATRVPLESAAAGLLVRRATAGQAVTGGQPSCPGLREATAETEVTAGESATAVPVATGGQVRQDFPGPMAWPPGRAAVTVLPVGQEGAEVQAAMAATSWVTAVGGASAAAAVQA
ncbi:MAG: hypothetical protein KDB47_16435, partial [Mycobacterium sp.]|nr:hypothetical protein [Mycobacterium sp.]